MSALVDVTGILERAGADAAAPEGSQAWALAQVSTAIAELIEADKEYDDSLKAFSAGPRPDLTATSMDEWAEEWANVARRADLHDRLQSTKARRASALARVGGAK